MHAMPSEQEQKAPRRKLTLQEPGMRWERGRQVGSGSFLQGLKAHVAAAKSDASYHGALLGLMQSNTYYAPHIASYSNPLLIPTG